MLMLRNVLTTVCLVEIVIYLVKTLRLRFGQDFELNSWSRLWGWDFVNLLKLKFGWDSDAEFWSTCGFRSTSGTAIWFDESTQIKGPLWLWQCFYRWGTDVINRQFHISNIIFYSDCFIFGLAYCFWGYQDVNLENIRIKFWLGNIKLLSRNETDWSSR